MSRIRTSLLAAAVVLLATAPMALAGGEEEASGAGASSIPAGYFGTYEPAIDMQWIKSTWQSAREAVNSKLNPATGETFEDNRWTRAMRDELGINVIYKWVAIALMDSAISSCYAMPCRLPLPFHSRPSQAPVYPSISTKRSILSLKHNQLPRRIR